VTPFESREDAGERLGRRLVELGIRADVVLGLPRGGVIVAAGVARALGAPLDIVACRKLGAPENPEYALGATAEGDVVVLNDDEVEMYLSPDELREHLRREVERQALELARQVTLYRGGRPAIPIEGKSVVLVDDGIATGLTMQAAVQSARRRGACRTIVAAPVAPPETVRRFASYVDGVVVLMAPVPFYAVVRFYADFSQVTDDEVVDALAQCRCPSSD